MVPLTLVIILATDAAALPAATAPPPKHVRCAGACAARYRIPGSASDGYSAKDRALANDGSKCDVVGARRCTSKRHTVLRLTEDSMDGVGAALFDD